MTKNAPPLTVLTISKEAFMLKLEELIDRGETIGDNKIETAEDLAFVKSEYSDWNDYNSEFLKQSFNIPENEYKYSYDKCSFSIGIGMGKNGQTPRGKLIKLVKSLEAKLSNLKKLHSKAELLKTQYVEEKHVSLRTKEDLIKTDNIFIVHGHNSGIKETVARIVGKLGLKPIILSEQPNEGKTIIEKFEHHSGYAAFAIILLTGDDHGKVKDSTEDNLRARQNVILEMGYFIGKLGRKNIFTMHETGVELPSDIHGVLYHPIDKGNTWKFSLVKELKAAGYNVNANDVL